MMLDSALKKYVKGDVYPFHMPGHKRIPLDTWNPYETDITEIDGFDNLHHAEGLLLQAQNRAAKLYGAEQSFYLVNGSTCGILTALSACVKKHGKILVARNSHKSVYNALYLRELEAVYLYPEITAMGLQGNIKAEQVKAALEAYPDIQAVMITSPTYDGIVSDVKHIAEIVHAYDIPLIVDAAHGAHFGFVEGFPDNPVRLGADVVIESVHKTLPAFTQTALLHVCSRRVEIERIKQFLGIYETSSPSYLLMAGIDRCMEYMKVQGVSDFQKLLQNLNQFYEDTQNLKHFKVLQKADFSSEEAFDFDKSKLLIFSKRKEVTGVLLSEILLKDYHLQMEMASGQYVLALCSLFDTKEGFMRLAEALKEIDKSFIWKDTIEAEGINIYPYRRQKQALPIYEAVELEKCEIPITEAEAQIAGEYLFLYPPGIPFLVPGEVITQEVICDICSCQESGLEVLGLSGKNGILVVNFS